MFYIVAEEIFESLTAVMPDREERRAVVRPGYLKPNFAFLTCASGGGVVHSGCKAYHRQGVVNEGAQFV